MVGLIGPAVLDYITLCMHHKSNILMCYPLLLCLSVVDVCVCVCVCVHVCVRACVVVCMHLKQFFKVACEINMFKQ